MSEKLLLEIHQYAKGEALTVTPLAAFDPQHFSKRELALLKKLADEFKHTQSEDMIERTHVESEPWDRVYNILNQKQQEIPYAMAARAQEAEVMERIKNEREEVRSNFMGA